MTKILRAAAALAMLIGLVGTTSGLVFGAGVAAPGYAASDYSTGFPASGYCCGPVGLVFDATHQLLVSDYGNGYFYKVPVGGGAPMGPFAFIGCGNAGLAFDKLGNLYVARQSCSDIEQISPVDGSFIRTVATGVPCATGLATDPLSGDLFATTLGCGNTIMRIPIVTNPGGPATVYATPGGSDGITIAPDGTMYTESNGCVTKIGGTNTAPTVTQLACVNSMDGIAVAASADQSQPPFVYTNNNDGSITKVDLTTSPPTLTQIVTGGTRGDFVTVGFDGCLYATQTSSIEKVTNQDGTCNLAPTAPVNCAQTGPTFGKPTVVSGILQVPQTDQNGYQSNDYTGSTNVAAGYPNNNASPGQTTTFTNYDKKQTTGVSATLKITAVDDQGCQSTFDPLLTSTMREQGKPQTDTYSGIAQSESLLTVYNGTPGVENMKLSVNGKSFQLHAMKDGDQQSISIASALTSGNNTISVTSTGRPGGSAVLLVAPPK